MKVPVINTLTLYGIDKACYQLALKLDAALSWLNYSFGRCEIITRKSEDKDEVYPAHFVNNQYDLQPVTPDDRWGNYCFWVIGSGKGNEKDAGMSHSPRMSYDASVIFYGDVTAISTSTDFATTKSSIRAEILGALTRKVFGFGGVLTLNAITEDYKEVFKGYSYDIPVIYPKFCFKIDVTISILEDCI